MGRLTKEFNYKGESRMISLFESSNNIIWYLLFGIIFGFILQRSRLCFVSATSDPFLTSSTVQFRGILIGILTASVGITAIKYLSNGTLDLLGVSAISVPLFLGAFIFGIGMILCGACTTGMFVRMAEGYAIHFVTLISVIAGYLLANSHYQALWAPMIANSLAIFLPHELGWIGGVLAHIVLIMLLYLVALRFEEGTAPSNSTSYLKGGVFLGLFIILHYIVLQSTCSVTGAFFWLSDLSAFTDAKLSTVAIGPNLRNVGLFVGALISALIGKNWKLKKIRSSKQVCRNAVGGILMGYGACIASGCNISAFFTAAASLSLSAWVFLPCFFAGAFVGTKILAKWL